MERVFTDDMLRARALARRLQTAELVGLRGRRFRLGPGPDGLDALVSTVRHDVDASATLDGEARGLVDATFATYDFVDIRLVAEPGILARHGARGGMGALRTFGVLALREGMSEQDARECGERVFAMYEEGLATGSAYVHIFARARRSWWSRATRGERARGQRPATLVIERAVVSNCRVGPWPFRYL